jgi:hypothetical protein
VQPDTLAGQQVPIHRLLQQSVAEGITLSGGIGHQQVGGNRLPQPPLQSGLWELGRSGQQLMPDPSPSHCRCPQRLLGGIRQSLDARQQHLGERRGQRDLGMVGAGGKELLGIQRVALRSGKNPLQRWSRQPRAMEYGKILGQLSLAEGAERQPLHPGSAAKLSQPWPQAMPAG